MSEGVWRAPADAGAEGVAERDDTSGELVATTEALIGTGGQESLLGQVTQLVGRPGPGATLQVVAAPGQLLQLDFDPAAAQVVLQGNDLILVFPDGGRIVLEGMVELAQSDSPPVFDIGGVEIAGDSLLGRALTLVEQETLVTAIRSGPVDGGSSVYDDDLGNLIDINITFDALLTVADVDTPILRVTGDNVDTDSVAFTVTVGGGDVSPEAAIGLPSGVAAIKEDSVDNVVEFSANSGDATDELTTVVITLPGVLADDVDSLGFGADAAKVLSTSIADDGRDTTITITLNPSVETLEGSFTLDAPVKDSDVDLSNIEITANAKDSSDPSATGSETVTETIVVDADGFVIQGDEEYTEAGYSVSGAGDVNGDGFDDLIVGAPRGGVSESGEAYVVFGKAGGGTVDLADLAASDEGFVIQGDEEGDQAGYSVSGAGDVNGDGFDDLIVGAPREGFSESGEAYVVFGGAFGGDGTPVTTTGTAAAEVLIGGLGDDSLTGGGGADVFRSGAGDDLLTVADVDFARIDGGTGFDTLALAGAGLHLDFSAIDSSSKVTDIEAVDLTGSGDNSLVLNVQDLLQLSDETNDLFVLGDTGDTVELTGDFAAADPVDVDGTIYNVYTSTWTEAQLLAETDVDVTLVVV